MKDNKQIGAAKYLNKTNGDYIPFRMLIGGTNCSHID